MIRIHTFGDSIMKGVVLDGSNKYSYTEDSFVVRCERNFGLNIDNRAHYGNTIIDGLALIDKRRADIKVGDFVLLEFGSNDSNYNWELVCARPDDDISATVPLEQFRGSYEVAIDKLLELGAKPILLTLPPLDGKLFYEFLSETFNNTAILRFIGGEVSNFQHFHELYNLEIFKLAARKNVPLIDITSIFYEQKRFSSFYCSDGVHPNDTGHQLIAEAIIDYFAQFIEL